LRHHAPPISKDFVIYSVCRGHE